MGYLKRQTIYACKISSPSDWMNNNDFIHKFPLLLKFKPNLENYLYWIRRLNINYQPCSIIGNFKKHVGITKTLLIIPDCLLGRKFLCSYSIWEN